MAKETQLAVSKLALPKKGVDSEAPGLDVELVEAGMTKTSRMS